MSSRRNFLKSSAGLAATFAVGPLAGAQTTLPLRFPRSASATRKSAPWRIRLQPVLCIISVQRPDAEWNTPDLRLHQTLFQCQQNGINAYQVYPPRKYLLDLKVFRAQGGKMKFRLSWKSK